jgi:hypothetical protein
MTIDTLRAGGGDGDDDSALQVGVAGAGERSCSESGTMGWVLVR